MTLWVCGRLLSSEVEGAWNMVGVFSTETLAVAACKDHTYFVGPVEVDAMPPEEPTIWEGSYLPHRATVWDTAQ